MDSFSSGQLPMITDFFQQRNSKLSLNDIVKFVSEVNLRARLEDVTIVMKILHRAKERRGRIIEDANYVYCTRTHEIPYDNSYISNEPIWDSYYGKWIKEVPPPPKRLQARQWYSKFGKSGYGALSLVSTVKRCRDDPTTLLETAKQLNVSSSLCNKPQFCSPEEGEMIVDVHTYSRFEDVHFIDYLLGYPHEKYCFRTEYGGESFWLCIWHTEHGRVQLFYTLQCGPAGCISWWEHISPPYWMILYNKDLVIQFPEKELHIHDDIARADSSNTDTSVGTWAGDISHYSFIDWSLLKGRTGKVKYIFDQDNAESFTIGAHLLQQLKLMGINLELHPIKKFRENITWL